MVHEVQLIDYSVVCESSSHGKGTLVLDATEADPINSLHVTSNELWQDLTITVAFSFKNLYEQVLMDHNGNVAIPPWVFKHATTPLCLGEVIFTGSAPTLRRIIVSLPYVVTGEPGTVDPSKLYSRWPIYSAPTKDGFPETGFDNVIYKSEDERVLYQWDDETGEYEQLVFAPSFVDTNTTYKLEIDSDDAHKIILYAKDIGEEDWRNVGEIETADTVYDDQELRSAVKNVSMLVGKTPVAEQISSVIRALSVPDEAVSGQFVTTVTQSDGKVTVARRALQESDVPTLGMGKVNGLQGALDSKAAVQSVTAVDNKVAQLNGTVSTVQGAVYTLVGNDANKSVRTIANEELAAQLIPEGATEALDTLQEIATWIQEHPNDAAALNSSIAAMQSQLSGIEAGSGTVKTYVDTAVQDLAQQVNQDIQEIELTPGPQGPQGEPGPTGPQGPPGADGQDGATGPAGADGADGFSPTVEVVSSEGAHTVTITDKSGEHEFVVHDGQDGAPGVIGAPGPAGADGQNGQDGQDGITPTIGENGNWFLGDTDTGKPSRGEQGPAGLDGAQVNDEAVSSAETWSSLKIIDTLCPPFAETGNPITCNPVERYPLDVAVTMEPIQSGTGDLSPENVRPISGRDEVTVTRCGKNLLNPENVAPISGAYGLTVTYENENILHIVGKPNNPSNGTLSFNVAETLDYSLSGKGLVITAYSLSGNLTAVNAYGLRTSTENAIVIVAYLDNTVTYDARIQLAVGVENLTTYKPYQGDTYDISLPEMVYGGTVDAVTGVGSKTWGFIASYNEESLPGEWISDRDVYSPGTTPTTGAQVAYKLATPEPFQATGNQPIPALAGQNTVYTDGNSLAVSGRSDPTAYIQQQISDAITAAVAITGGT